MLYGSHVGHMKSISATELLITGGLGSQVQSQGTNTCALSHPCIDGQQPWLKAALVSLFC